MAFDASKPTGATKICDSDEEIRANFAAIEAVIATIATPASFAVTAAKLMFLNETANAEMTIGLTINQAANDDEIIALKSSGVAHGMTTPTETDTYGIFKMAESGSGGIRMDGYKDADGVAGYAVYITGYLGEAADDTKSTLGIGVISLASRIKADAGDADVGADGNLVVIRNRTTTRFAFDAEGEMHSDAIIGVGDDWDEWDDLALASDLSRLPGAKFNEMMKYKAQDFEKAGLLTLSVDEQGTQHAFIRHKAMLQFSMCCFAEIANKLKRYEQAFSKLGIGQKELLALEA